jgi:hypothetical protein
MRGLKGVLGNKRNRLIILLLTFLVVDSVLIGYTSSSTTDTKEGALLQSDLVISEAETSAFGNTVCLAEGSLYMVLPSGLVRFEGSENLTSYAFGYLSEAVVVVTEHRVLNYYARGAIEPSFSKLMDADTEVLCIRETASASDYIPVDIALLTQNQTGSYFVPVTVNSQGSSGIASILPGNAVSDASARSGGYITIACDVGSLVTFRMGHDAPIATLPYEGQIEDMVMVDNGMKIYVLHQGGSILALKPANGFVYGWTNLSETVASLVLGEDGESVYALDGDRLMAVSGPEGALVFSGEGITAFAIPASYDFVICQDGLVSFYQQGRANPLWDGEVQGTCIGANTDFGATSILVWTDGGDLFIYDNTIPTLGAREWWQLIGALVILELLVLISLAWGRNVAGNGSHGLIVLFAGAMAGLIITIIFPNQGGVDWFGGELPVAAIVMTSGAVASYAAWESGSGVWGVILGIIAGSITAAVTGLIMMFLLWASGMEFGGQDAYFTTLVNSVPLGFTASIAAGVVGVMLSYAFIPGENKKVRG